MIDLLLDFGGSSVLLGDELAVNHRDSLETEGEGECASTSWTSTSTYKLCGHLHNSHSMSWHILNALII